VVPDAKLVNYKEALIFALLGAARVSNSINIKASATGAEMDHVAGSLDGDFSSLIGKL
jgi:anhydro-N-acetylmuramic acid kinase